MKVKDTTCYNRNEALWLKKKEFWIQDARTTNDKLLPIEIVAMYNLRDLRGSETVVRIGNFRFDTPKKMYRIYMEYCGFGDCSTPLSRYFDKRREKPPKNPSYVPVVQRVRSSTTFCRYRH